MEKTVEKMRRWGQKTSATSLLWTLPKGTKAYLNVWNFLPSSTSSWRCCRFFPSLFRLHHSYCCCYWSDLVPNEQTISLKIISSICLMLLVRKYFPIKWLIFFLSSDEHKKWIWKKKYKKIIIIISCCTVAPLPVPFALSTDLFGKLAAKWIGRRAWTGLRWN